MSAGKRPVPIPILDLGQDYDQRYADADFHYGGHGQLCEVFGRSVAVHRHDRFFQIHYIHNGQVHLYLDDNQYHLDGPLCFLTPPGVPHAFVTAQDSEGQVITVRQQLVWKLFEDEAALAPRLNRAMCILRLILANLLRLAEQSQHKSPAPAEDLRQFHRFNLLVEAHHIEHWPLQHYADELGLTTARLNLICRRLANMSSKQLIFERLLQEAKRLLLHSGQSVNQISFALGFSDPAYFSRFFSRHVGMPASDYRASRSPS